MFDFLKLIDRKKAAAILVLGLISGFTSFLFLAFINLMIQLVFKQENTTDFNYIILFCFLMLAFTWSRRALAYLIIKFSQQIFWRLRSEILHTILRANFYQFSKRKDEIYSTLTSDIGVLTGFSLSIINLLSAFIMIVGCFTYMAIQSQFLFLLTLGIAVLGVVIYLIGVHLNNKKLEVSRNLENKFMRNFIDILSGFKEIHMNPKIGQDIFNRKIREISNESYINNTSAYTGFLNVQITGEVLFYLLIAFILIFNSSLGKESPTSIVNFVFILLYVLGSIDTLLQLIPGLLQARIASSRIYKLKQELNDERFENQLENRKISMNEFNDLHISDLMFSHENEKNEMSFSIGPVNLSLKKGEAVFIYGGNGSGKTTLINAILGILKSNSGKIQFNETEVCANNYSEYRTLFSIVFTDFHIFDELYGFDEISEDEINNYLKIFELDGKVFYTNNSFSSKNLSTGQRKRLALIISLIRAHPILVLDEWAADQDPIFRKKFYTQIIPELKAKGFSIIAITHDDAYYHAADRLYKMDFGKLSLEYGNIIK